MERGSANRAWEYSGKKRLMHEDDGLAGDKLDSGKSTGPRTRDGKDTSSQNAMKHGCRARRLILGDERQEDYDRMAAGWKEEFGGEGQAGESLLQRVILNDWQLRRAERRHMEAETELAEVEPMEWTAEQHHKLELFLRYKTTAERSFYRAYNALYGLIKDRIRVEMSIEKVRERVGNIIKAGVKTSEQEKAQEEKAQEKTPAQMLFRGQKNRKKMRKIQTLEQWVEIRIRDGKTVTELYPSNDVLIEDGKKMDPPPEFVYRRMHFPDGVPEEYAWTTRDPVMRKYGGMGIQRMTPDTWLETIKREEHDTRGHIGRTGVGNLPRPKERGECDCPSCVRGQLRLDKAAGG